MNEEERWQPLKEKPNYYEISTLGNIRSVGFTNQWGYHRRKKPRMLKQTHSRKGYKQVTLAIGNRSRLQLVHRLVASNFIGDLSGKEVNHINGIKDDNRVENLEICTRSENMRHAYDVLGIKATPQRAHSAQRKAILCLNPDGSVIAEYPGVRAAAETLGHSHAQISIAARNGSEAYGFKWKYKQ